MAKLHRWMTFPLARHGLGVSCGPGGGAGPSPGVGTLHTFTLHNTSGAAATPAMARLGLAFTKGDVPAGQRLAVRVAGGGSPVAFAAAAATNSWADGSLRSTADGGLVMVDSSPIAVGDSRTYEVYAESGSQAASGFDPWAWLAAHANDLTVDITGRTGSSSGALPDLAFSLKTAIATATRREILCDTGRFVRIKAWQKVSGEEHLVCEFHLDFWLDGSGVPVALEFASILTQHWWVNNPFGTTQTKERQTYDAVVKYGATTLDSRTGLAHAYYCRWASLRSDDDAQHGRKHWISLGTAMPTARVRYDDSSLKRMMKAGYIPPFRLGVSYTGDLYPLTSTYTPLGANGHRAAINGTGGYVGRGMWGDPDAKLVCRQASATAATAEGAWRASRVMAQAGLAVFAHARDHRSTSGVNGGTDTTNRLIPHPFRQAAAVSSQSYAGLGAPAAYVSMTLNNTGGGISTIAHAAPAGGTGAFSSYDAAHAVNYSAPVAFLEGEAYLADAAVSLFNKTCTYLNWNNIGHDRRLLYSENTTRRTTQSIPYVTNTNNYGGVPDCTSQERCLAWSLNLMLEAYNLRADAHSEQALIKNFILNFNKFWSDSFDYLTSSDHAFGYASLDLVSDTDGTRVSPWMGNWQGQAAFRASRVFDFLPDNGRGMNGVEEIAHKSARYMIRLAFAAPYAMLNYHSIYAQDVGWMTPLPLDEYPDEVTGVVISGSVLTASLYAGHSITNGDKVRLMGNNASGGNQTLPSGLSIGPLYYVVNKSGSTFQLSDSPGGSPLTIGDHASLVIFMSPATYASVTPIGAGGAYFPLDDHYGGMAFANFECAVGNNHADMTTGKRDKIRTFFAPKIANYSNFASWNFDGDNLL